ncbi:hypothetical protein RRG08_019383 [Elysia crispata]|uniref:Uncharacterized protein n=1 Tax=Elysia crispata TaxID=231223 RepID=A0AAE0XU87_9GAST|nr:hypothetical protein RRG08_019383 [Elysia crispata]
MRNIAYLPHSQRASRPVSPTALWYEGSALPLTLYTKTTTRKACYYESCRIIAPTLNPTVQFSVWAVLDRVFWSLLNVHTKLDHTLASSWFLDFAWTNTANEFLKTPSKKKTRMRPSLVLKHTSPAGLQWSLDSCQPGLRPGNKHG